MNRSILYSLFAAVLVAPPALAAPAGAPALAVTGISGGVEADVATTMLVTAAGKLSGVALVAPEVALRGGAPATSWRLDGAMKNEGVKGWTLTMNLVSPAGARQSWQWTGSDPAGGVSNACLRLTGALQLAPKPEEWQAVGAVLRPPKSKQAWELGLAARRSLWTGQYDQAAARLAQVVKLDPEQATAWVQLAQAHRLSGERWRWLPAFAPGRLEAQASGRRQLEAAVSATQRAAKDPEAWAELALAQALAGGEAAGARRALDEARRLGGASAALRLATALVQNDAASWRQVTDADPDAAAYVLAAAKAAGDGNAAGAYAFYQKAAVLEPGMPAALYGQVRTLAAQKRFAEAHGKADELAKREPAIGQWLKGTLHLETGELERAQATFDAAAAAQPRSATLTYFQGRCQFARGESEHALESLRSALYLDPQHGPSHMLVGVLYQDRLKQDRLARFHLERAAALMPELQPSVTLRLAKLAP